MSSTADFAFLGSLGKLRRHNLPYILPLFNSDACPRIPPGDAVKRTRSVVEARPSHLLTPLQTEDLSQGCYS